MRRINNDSRQVAALRKAQRRHQAIDEGTAPATVLEAIRLASVGLGCTDRALVRGLVAHEWRREGDELDPRAVAAVVLAQLPDARRF